MADSEETMANMEVPQKRSRSTSPSIEGSAKKPHLDSEAKAEVAPKDAPTSAEAASSAMTAAPIPVAPPAAASTTADIDEESAANVAVPTASSSQGPTSNKKKERRDWKAEAAAKRGQNYQGKKRRGDREGEQGQGSTKDADRSNAVEGDEENEGNGEKRLTKKRAAVMIGYCGAGYSGLQIQNDVKTIEGEIFAALIKAGAVSADNADDHRKVDMQRSARTDAGVHAAGNCISLKMILEPPLPEGYSTLASYVNSFLPEQIKMWGFVRTIKSFQARMACDSRVYEYLLPSYCLLPPASSDPLSKMLDESSPGWREGLGEAAVFADARIVTDEESDEDMQGEDAKAEPGVEELKQVEGAASSTEVDAGTKSEPSGESAKSSAQDNENEATAGGGNERVPSGQSRGEYERKRNWRVDEATMKRFRTLVAEFKGTHNFHNYTVGKPFNDRSVKRYMIRIDVRDPKVVGNIEWVSVQIHGQSFMLHQIRKMMSLAMLACRTNSPANLIPETYGPKRIHIPKAPPLGLLLEQPQFKTYNDRIGTKGLVTNEDRDAVDFSLYKDEMEEFKLKYIYDKLRQDELETHVFHKWIRQIDTSPSKQLAFLNSKGVIPPEAQLTLGRPPKESKDAKERGGGGRQAEGGEAKSAKKDSALDSDDEDIDEQQLKRGELEG